MLRRQDEMKDIIYELQLIQKKLKNSKQDNAVLPIEMSKIDIEINNFIDTFGFSNIEEKIKKQVPNDVAWLLIGFGFNMATYSLRHMEQRYFTNGLIALSIASKTIDLREILKILVLYWDVFKKKELSFEGVLSQNNDFTKELKKFLEREESSKSLECMGFEIIGKAECVQYRVVSI